MKGKDVLLDSLANHGVRYLFGNPGTTESPLIDALLDRPEFDYILALHESVATGAAHYYAQASGNLGFVNVHVAPGLGNALGMLHNAAEAGSPLLLTAGQQDTRMRLREPLLSGDLVAMAEPLAKWSVQAQSADELAHLLHRAIKIATDPPTGPVFVSLPIDVLEQRTENAAWPKGDLYRKGQADPGAIEQAVSMIVAAERPVIIVGDGVMHDRARGELVSLSEQIGARVYFGGLQHNMNFPTSHPHCGLALPLDYAGMRKVLVDPDLVLLIGGRFFEEVWFDHGSPFPDTASVVQLENHADSIGFNFSVDLGIVADVKSSLVALAQAVAESATQPFSEKAQSRCASLRAESEERARNQKAQAEEAWHRSPIAVSRLMAEIGRRLDSLGRGSAGSAFVVNEAITGGGDLLKTIPFGDELGYYGIQGGGIGQSLPGAIGVQLANPGSTVVALSGDGSAMYSIQALWTAAHHGLPVKWIILHNKEYRVLKHNMAIYRRRFDVPSDRPFPHMNLEGPVIDYEGLAGAMGVPAATVSNPNQLGAALDRALGSDGPYLLDVMIEGLET